MMVALDKKTGKEIWRSKVPEFGQKGKPGAGYGSAVISNGAGVKQYVQMTGQGVIESRAEDGKFLWGYDHVANDVANISTPVVIGDHVFASTAYGAGAGLVKLAKDGDGVKAEEVYFIDPNKLQNHHGGMVLVNGHIYCGHKQNGGDPVCVDIKTGELKWGPVKAPGKGSAAVSYVDGHLIFRYQNGLLAAGGGHSGRIQAEGHLQARVPAEGILGAPGGVRRTLSAEQDRMMCYEL